jgi:FtsP/CotA-like multicopper oxidase with cupredoxin domain
MWQWYGWAPTCAASILVSYTVVAGELDPLKEPPLLDKSFVACAAKPSPEIRTIHLVTREAVRHDVGPYSVRLPGYSTDEREDSYAPMRIEACAGDTLRIDLANRLPSNYAQSDTNLHTHGLIVNPTPDKPGPPGDYIFLDVPPGHTENYRITIPQELPGTMFGRSKHPQPYPSGLYWFHAHRHIFARNQVQAGEAGVLSIGNPLEISYHDSQGKTVIEPLPGTTQTTYLVLRDIQIAVSPGLLPSKAHGELGEWLNGQDGRPDYDSTACNDASAWYQNGACGHGGLTVNGQPRELVWLFTVNGQLFPKISYTANRPQLWRIANLSSNVTYLLEIAAGDDPRVEAPTRQFFVLTLDGIVAGAPIENEGFELLGVGLRRLLLMPGSRAEIYLPPDECSGVATLRTAGIQTGPNPPSKPTGDQWPAIKLARVETTHSGVCTQSRAFSQTPLARPAELNVRIPARDASLSRPTPGANAETMLSVTQPSAPDAIAATLSKLHPSCVFLPQAIDGKSYRRQIVFEQDSEYFKLGSEVVDASGNFVPNTRIAAEKFPDPINWKTTKHVCAVFGAQEVWELVNNTDEMHNFHIHQSKFRLADSRLDEGVPPGLTAIVSTNPNCDEQPSRAAFCDPLGVVGKNVSEAGGAIPDQAVDLWHDTIPVPPRSSNGHPGRVFVSIPFKSPQQEGRFVFHCHILEHEDAGMMAPIEVLSAASIARQQEDELVPAMNMPSKRTDLWRDGFSSLLGGSMVAPSSDLSLNAALASSICTSDGRGERSQSSE